MVAGAPVSDLLGGGTDVDEAGVAVFAITAGSEPSVVGFVRRFGLGRVDTGTKGEAGFDPVASCAIAEVAVSLADEVDFGDAV